MKYENKSQRERERERERERLCVYLIDPMANRFYVLVVIKIVIILTSILGLLCLIQLDRFSLMDNIDTKYRTQNKELM